MPVAIRDEANRGPGFHDRRFRAIRTAGSDHRPAERIIFRVLGHRTVLMANPLTWLAVGGGGALGSMARFWLTGAVAAITGPRFPYGTLLINILGSFVIGAVAGLTLTPARMGMHPDVRIFLMVGICGGFTTFSAFSLQMLELLQTGELVPALLYAVGSVLLCLLFVWCGWWLGRL
jgi:CrcB protein